MVFLGKLGPKLMVNANPAFLSGENAFMVSAKTTDLELLKGSRLNSV